MRYKVVYYYTDEYGNDVQYTEKRKTFFGIVRLMLKYGFNRCSFSVYDKEKKVFQNNV